MKPLTQSISQSVNQSINQSISQSINQSINQSISQSVNQSINHSIVLFCIIVKKIPLTASPHHKSGKYKAAQAIVLVISVLLFIVMNLFPPWNAVVNPPADNETVFVGYRFISDPPHSPYGYGSIIIVNYTRLLVQWGILIVFAMALYGFFGYRAVKEASASGNGLG